MPALNLTLELPLQPGRVLPLDTLSTSTLDPANEHRKTIIISKQIETAHMFGPETMLKSLKPTNFGDDPTEPAIEPKEKHRALLRRFRTSA